MNKRAFRRANALRRFGVLVCVASMVGCAVPGTSVHYGQIVSEPTVYYDPVPLAPAPYFDPPIYYGGATVIAPAPIIVDRPIYSPWYPVAPVYRGSYYRYHDYPPPRRHPSNAHRPGFDRDRGDRRDQGARPPPRPGSNPGIRSSQTPPQMRGLPGGPTPRSSGENSGP